MTESATQSNASTQSESGQPDSRLSKRTTYGLLCCALVVLAFGLAYNRYAITDLFSSDFDEVTMDGKRFMEKGSSRPFSGTLQIRGTQILEVGHVQGRIDGEFKNWLEDGSVYEFATYEAGRKTQSSRSP